jgi:asparagine synthase (glutamine-hydrolysing)
MCGIYGITKNDTQFIHQFIEKCTHRGPDGSDIWHDEDVTLGHNLLAITSEPSQGKQPWKTPKGNVLVYNGEIFNYQELCNKYHNQFTPITTCDTELLAFLLDRDPQQTIKEIDSMHGFAYYDRQTKKLIISRDHAGIKPLYYAETQDGLVFGSEIKGMLDKVPNSNKIDDIASACMSYCGVNATNHSLFNNIRKVMPGQTLTYDVANKKFAGSNTYTIHPTSNKNLDLEEFRHEAHETVKMSTLGIRKFGMFLSGGLDSTLVAHELNSVLGGLDTFTNRMNPNIITDEDHNDDANHARMFADDYKMNHTEIEITPQMMMDCWDKTMWFMEQPVYNWNMPMYYETNKKLAEAGVVVTMAGDMGDELLGGYPKYWKLTKPEEKIKSWEGLVWKWMHRIKRPVEMKRKISKEELHAILIKQMPQEVWNPADHVNSYMALDCVTQVPEDFFARNDKFGMAFSMEGRFPLATKRFMSYCLAINSQHKMGQEKSQTKLPTKLAYKGVMPDYIINKMKTGWTVPLMYWLNNNKELQSFMQSYMDKNDCLKNVISQSNQTQKKPRLISWMMRSWAQCYDMSV